jgi:hypothetical protein
LAARRWVAERLAALPDPAMAAYEAAAARVLSGWSE